MFQSKLPSLGTSIFTQMSMLANQYQAINLSQGFPEFDTPDFLKQQITHAISVGLNQYSPSNGIAPLQQQIAGLIARRYGHALEPSAAITVTSGATEALFVAIHTLVRPGDEVIIFDPAYDSYQPAIELAGGLCQRIALTAPNYAIDWQYVTSKMHSNVRAIIINSPHNPTGKVLKEHDLQALKALLAQYPNCYLISDEVYEHMTFDGHQHLSILSVPELFKRAFVISSFGKTFHCTGWKIGYCVAPEQLTAEFRKIHQYVTFSSFTPAQHGLAAMLQHYPEHVDQLADFYQQKRDLLVSHLASSRFKVLPSEGTYFVLLDYSAISDLNDVDFCHWLTAEVGVAAIPLSVFYQDAPADKVVRLCFAKNDATLIAAAEKLCRL
ncbi:methionine aminotransferase [Pseudoalteromonas tunicata]|uniref:methionine aminotransferase n=1 Tax=Pseudoalteromonas tunicata TaxID=314281 RepID=UPI00058FE6B7|nr:methionine aminotransferase [Pseudoalteromonas tunicata]ATC92958.1 methionine aminotransferase [Pseudoalteromonas tunicata]AXT32721.1 aminotransferase class I/II-fold pyridoxal phosphate-dependent enzyme [Pseudoalteromonas tunicata]